MVRHIGLGSKECQLSTVPTGGDGQAELAWLAGIYKQSICANIADTQKTTVRGKPVCQRGYKDRSRTRLGE